MIKSIFSKILVLKILTLVTLNASAHNSPPFSTELGFNRLSHPSTPPMLTEASKSVFEVRSISEDKVEEIQTWDLTDPKFADVEKKIETIASLEDARRFGGICEGQTIVYATSLRSSMEKVFKDSTNFAM